MLDFLKKSYPFNDDLKRNAKIIFLLSIGVLVFLLLLQPLDISSLGDKDKIYLVIGFGVITFLSLSLNLLILPSFFSKIFLNNDWIVWKEIIWDLWILFTISFGYYLLYKTVGILEFDFYMMVKLIFVAVIPLTLLIVFNQNRLLKLHLETVNELNRKLTESKLTFDKLVHFDLGQQNDKFSIKAKLIVLIKSADNYIEIFWKDGNSIKKQLLRGTLSKTQELLSEYKFIFKCHRSFIININYINRVDGNTQGYKLFLDGIDFEIPVSKSSIDTLKEKIKIM
jgi:hypothetical protein